MWFCTPFKHYHFFFCILSHFCLGSIFRKSLSVSPYLALPRLKGLSDKSFLVLSNHLRFGLALLLFPNTPSPSLFCPHILLNTCPYHFNLLSYTFLDICSTFAVPLILSFLILPTLVTPLVHLNILISATSNFFFCSFFTAPCISTIHHCWSYIHLVYFPLDLQAYSLVTQNPRYPLPVFPSSLYSMHHPGLLYHTILHLHWNLTPHDCNTYLHLI